MKNCKSLYGPPDLDGLAVGQCCFECSWVPASTPPASPGPWLVCGRGECDPDPRLEVAEYDAVWGWNTNIEVAWWGLLPPMPEGM